MAFLMAANPLGAASYHKSRCALFPVIERRLLSGSRSGI